MSVKMRGSVIKFILMSPQLNAALLSCSEEDEVGLVLKGKQKTAAFSLTRSDETLVGLDFCLYLH